MEELKSPPVSQNIYALEYFFYKDYIVHTDRKEPHKIPGWKKMWGSCIHLKVPNLSIEHRYVHNLVHFIGIHIMSKNLLYYYSLRISPNIGWPSYFVHGLGRT